MTLPVLLSKVSRREPTFVTVDGMVVAGDTVSRSSEGHFEHELLGRVTPVARHTDHGGTPAPDDETEPWWNAAPHRLDAEAKDMHSRFPGFSQRTYGGRPAWEGEVNTGRGVFGVVVVHRADHGLPRVVPKQPSLFRRREGKRLRPSPHLYLNGNLCVASESDWDPQVHDATVVVAWAAHWLASFTEWRITGRWPSETTEVEAT